MNWIISFFWGCHSNDLCCSSDVSTASCFNVCLALGHDIESGRSVGGGATFAPMEVAQCRFWTPKKYENTRSSACWVVYPLIYRGFCHDVSLFWGHRTSHDYVITRFGGTVTEMLFLGVQFSWEMIITQRKAHLREQLVGLWSRWWLFSFYQMRIQHC